MLLGAVGGNVEAEKVSTICMRVVQWGQRKPVGTAGDSAPGDDTGLG